MGAKGTGYFSLFSLFFYSFFFKINSKHFTDILPGNYTDHITAACWWSISAVCFTQKVIFMHEGQLPALSETCLFAFLGTKSFFYYSCGIRYKWQWGLPVWHSRANWNRLFPAAFFRLSPHRVLLGCTSFVSMLTGPISAFLRISLN